MKTLMSLIFFFSCSLAIAGIGKNTTVSGTIVKFNKKTVTLSQNGHHSKVPRKAIPKHFKIKKGNEVYAVFEGKRVLSSLKKQHKKNMKEYKARKKKK